MCFDPAATARTMAEGEAYGTAVGVDPAPETQRGGDRS